MTNYFFLLLFVQTYSLLTRENVQNKDYTHIKATYSEELLLRRDYSLLMYPLENIGTYGAFANYDIVKGGFICEYRGQVTVDKVKLKSPNFKTLRTQGLDGLQYNIIGQNFCATIKDCTSIQNHSCAEGDLIKLEQSQSAAKCYDGFSHNAKVISNYGGTGTVVH